MVAGMVKAQYNLKCLGSSHLTEGIAKSAAKKVLGRKDMVRMAILFMDELSSLAAAAILMLVSESSWKM